jgi:hypothetical protein
VTAALANRPMRANFTAAMAFQFASTNLVIELAARALLALPGSVRCPGAVSILSMSLSTN